MYTHTLMGQQLSSTTPTAAKGMGDKGPLSLALAQSCPPKALQKSFQLGDKGILETECYSSNYHIFKGVITNITIPS